VYTLVKCTKCGEVQGTSGKTRATCLKCGKSWVIVRGWVYGRYESASQAGGLLRALKRRVMLLENDANK